MAAWQYANTYTPWTVPNGADGTGNPSFGSYGGTTTRTLGESATAAAIGGGLGMTGMVAGAAGPLTPAAAAIGALFGALPSGKGKKRSSPDFYAPSYQGTMFTPQEGFPDWYTNGDTSDDWMGSSYQGLVQDQMVQNLNSGADVGMMYPKNGVDGAEMNAISSINPYDTYAMSSSMFGQPGYNYVPSMGSSYGGYPPYSNYTGNGTSPESSSTYKPFVPTGYSGGQY